MKQKFLLTSAIFFALITNSYAETIGIIDVEKIIQESTAIVDIQSKVDKKKSAYESEIEKKQSALQQEQKKIEAKKDVLSQESFEKEVKAFDKKLEDLKTYIDRKQNSLKKASLEAMSKVNDKVKIIVSEVAKEKEFNIVIPASQTVHFDENLDITEEVLKRLNKKISKVDVKFE